MRVVETPFLVTSKSVKSSETAERNCCKGESGSLPGPSFPTVVWDIWTVYAVYSQAFFRLCGRRPTQFFWNDISHCWHFNLPSGTWWMPVLCAPGALMNSQMCITFYPSGTAQHWHHHVLWTQPPVVVPNHVPNSVQTLNIMLSVNCGWAPSVHWPGDLLSLLCIALLNNKTPIRSDI